MYFFFLLFHLRNLLFNSTHSLSIPRIFGKFVKILNLIQFVIPLCLFYLFDSFLFLLSVKIHFYYLLLYTLHSPYFIYFYFINKTCCCYVMSICNTYTCIPVFLYVCMYVYVIIHIRTPI